MTDRCIQDEAERFRHKFVNKCERLFNLTLGSERMTSLGSVRIKLSGRGNLHENTLLDRK